MMVGEHLDEGRDRDGQAGRHQTLVQTVPFGPVGVAHLRRLPGHAQPVGDLRPRVAELPQPPHGGAGDGVHIGRQQDQLPQRLNVTGGDPTRIGAQDPSGERGVVGVFHHPLGALAPSRRAWRC